MPNQKPFVFKALVGDATRHGQLKEWADHHHITLIWEEQEIKDGNKRTWESYPIIQGHEYPQFTGKGDKQRLARGQAAEMIYTSNGTLDKAKDKLPPTAVHIAPAHH